MGQVTGRKYIAIVPDKYWTSSYNNIKWIIKESKCQKKSEK